MFSPMRWLTRSLSAKTARQPHRRKRCVLEQLEDRRLLDSTGLTGSATPFTVTQPSLPSTI